ncbi:MAG: aminotransferase class V-fold PLP-dependent enzyme [Firmicutes bacterium]|nr:aminotransferase class V-fold PLP-dependent enzyme [Bacillota bacterium]
MSNLTENNCKTETALPLTGYMEEFTGMDPARFCTPGHKGNAVSGGLSGAPDSLFGYDIADDVASIPRKIRESESYAAQIYNTLRTFYLVNGSTAGILAMFLSVIKPGEKVVIGRNCHRSALSGLVLSGAVPAYALCDISSEGFQLNTTPQAVEKALDQNSDAKAVFITSPSYWGICADMEEIGRICRDRGVFLLADEAWGAHFPFGKNFPKSAIICGADLVVQSAHKTLPCLTGTSLLHICSSKTDPVMVEESLALVQTTSPNLLYYLSLEQGINRMKTDGGAALKTAGDTVVRFREIVKKGKTSCSLLQGCCPSDIYEIAQKRGFGTDPLKLSLFMDPVETGISGSELAGWFTDSFGIIPEMSDFNTIIFLLTGWEKKHHIDNLEKALKNLSDENYNSGIKHRGKKYSSVKIHPEDSCCLPPTTAVSPRAAHFFPKKQIDLEESEGEICGVPVVPYPPGIPVLMPGEIINAGTINILKKTASAGVNIRGIERNRNGWMITVLDD